MGNRWKQQVWCALLLILTASGHLLNSQSLECGNSEEDLVASRLRNEARLVYLWSGLSLPICTLLLLEFWRKEGFFAKVVMGTTSVLLVIMCVSFSHLEKKEAQEIKEFEERYLALLPLTDTPGNTENWLTDTTCHTLNNVHRWQAEFKCCGLQGHQDWESSIPDSCSCDGVDNSSGCVGAGNGFVHEKPCLPTVLSLVEKRSSTFRTVMIVWITIIVVPVAVWVLWIMALCFLCDYWDIISTCCYKLNACIYRLRGGEEMVLVLFIKENNNNQSEEGNGKDEEAKESGGDGGVVLDVEGTHAEGEGKEAAKEDLNVNPVTVIPLSELRRLQEELNPPPVQHQVWCWCILPSKPKTLYTVQLEEGSPLLPSGAVLVDPNKHSDPTFWANGHIFSFEHIVWPGGRERDPLL
ncbi:uncharacterized protein LOC121625870 isoform X2 [Chelmon rostratus]|uniref:uncharacterized protein LOC121625870 isoform X2 n=1 Tax=Chelmon rostratus TaxID=109905 RepID=UPI001BEA2C93|nr:uncharacterized protein LOC121625870 isoform X2 [Chelmon rostratus]